MGRRESRDGLPLVGPLDTHPELCLAFGAGFAQDHHGIQGLRIEAGNQVDIPRGILFPELAYLNLRDIHRADLTVECSQKCVNSRPSEWVRLEHSCGAPTVVWRASVQIPGLRSNLGLQRSSHLQETFPCYLTSYLP